VDFTLVGQYFYYWRSKPAPVSYGHRRARTSTSTTRRMSTDHGAPRYRTLSAAAANVAATAALAAQQDEQTNPRYHSRNRRWRRSMDQLGEGSGNHMAEETDEVDESALAALADSFHSEGGRMVRRRYVSWSRERGGVVGNLPVTKSAFFSPQPTSSGDTPDPLGRGRPLQRDGRMDTEEWVRPRTTSESGNKTSSRASRKGAGMVFLGVWALFGIGNLVGSRSGSSSDDQTSIGRVLTTDAISAPESTATVIGLFPADTPPPADYSTPLMFHTTYAKNTAPEKHHNENEALRQRIIGRIFAWLCATLYLTSRLPQIWKNVSLVDRRPCPLLISILCL
jgi:solute carrier family 66 (lysosomal lysine-arginine transporter), member 1